MSATALKFPFKPKARQRWKAPAHLAAPTKKWFARVARDFDLEEHHVRLLTAACESWDRMTGARETMAKEGVGTTYTDRFGFPKVRPEVAIERDARLAFMKLVRELALDVSAPSDDSRPPGIGAGRGRR